MNSLHNSRFLLAALALSFVGVLTASANPFSGSVDLQQSPRASMLFSEPDPIEHDEFAQNAASTAVAPTSITLQSGNFTLAGAPGETVTLDLRDFVLGGSASFTLQGTATTMFVINVSRKFSLSGNAAVVLSDGVLPSNVFFNVVGKGSVTMSGYSRLQGTLNAPERILKMKQHAQIYGWAMAKRISRKGAASIVHPPVVSP